MKTLPTLATFLALTIGSSAADLTRTPAGMVTGLAPSATIDATNASNVRAPLPANPTITQVINYSTYVDNYVLPTDPDSTAGIQRALNAAGNFGLVVFQCHAYTVSATLTGYYNQNIEGCVNFGTVLSRSTDYGDTLVIGNSATTFPGNSAGAATIENIWFSQNGAYSSTATSATLPNIVTKGAHIHLINAQGATIQNVYLQRMRFGVELDDSTITTLENIKTDLIYDPDYPAAQEGIAALWLHSVNANSLTIRVHHANMDGAFTAPRSQTIGSSAVSLAKNAGPVSQILADGAEDFDVSDSIIEKGSQCGVNMTQTAVSTAKFYEIRLHHNHFDGSGNPGSPLPTGDICGIGNNNFTLGLHIQGNHFNGETVSAHAIDIEPTAGYSGNSGSGIPAQTTAEFGSISDNAAYAYVGTPFLLNGILRMPVQSNSIGYYNTQNVSSNLSYDAGIFLYKNTGYILVSGNTLCGGGGTTQYGVYANVDSGHDGANNTDLGSIWQSGNLNAGCTTSLNN